MVVLRHHTTGLNFTWTMGRGQVVRRLLLAQETVGSTPTVPAKLLYKQPANWRAVLVGGFLRSMLLGVILIL